MTTSARTSNQVPRCAYVDEQAFRYNKRKRNGMSDADRFDVAVSQIVGKRLTYAELTGKSGARPEPF